MAHGSSLEYLYSQIERARVRSTSNRYFIQPSRVREIFNPQLIGSALAEIDCKDYDRIRLLEQIQHDGIITFAILVWMRRADFIVKFRNSDHLDSKLPIDERRAEDIASEVGLSLAREYQWEFLPYVFRKDMSDNHRKIYDLCLIFPFVDENDLGEGGYGQISRLTLPSNMQEFFTNVDDIAVSVVRKRIKNRDGQSMATYDDAFMNEMACLRLLNRLNHPNIIPLLGSYTFNKQHYLLFPYFEMDLKSLFTFEDRQQEFHEDYTFYLALAGLSSALGHTHELHLTKEPHGIDIDAIGYHFDIQPSNILVDRQRSTFILADFGLGKLKSNETNSETPWKIGGGDYIAPECMGKDFNRQQAGRAVDVWALGCLITELATYMALGPQGIQQFRKSRWSELAPGWETTYFYDAHGSLKPSVLRWIEELSSISTSSTKRILQIALGALDPNPHSRPRITKIRYQISALALRDLYDATAHSFSEFVEYGKRDEEQHPANMRLWFEGERLHALKHALPHTPEDDHPIINDSKTYSAFCDALIQILRTVRAELDGPGTDLIENSVNLSENFKDKTESWIQKLWDLLPSPLSRIAQAIWIQSMQSEDISRLEDIEVHYQLHQPQNPSKVGAAAHMRAIRLRMYEDPDLGAREFLHPWNELNHIQSIEFHFYGVFGQETRVLVEWMHYRPEWTNISEHQQLMIMELRAKDFNTDPKPQGLRILKCLGFVESPPDDGRQQGYGFLYELPAQVHEGEYPVTLRQLLIKGTTRIDEAYNQAPLLGRFRLGYALARFFQELYTVDFLHESFCSNNVVFAHSAEAMFASTAPWSDPYIVGFQKSRPDGQSWGTKGPSDDKSMLDYEHPDYRRTERFVVEYDYYSLGLVLLEIGLWCPLQLWSRKHKTLSPNEFRSLLLTKYVPRLASSVGEAYRDLVRACLDGTFERNRETSPSRAVDSEVFELFIRTIVGPLEELAQLRI